MRYSVFYNREEQRVSGPGGSDRFVQAITEERTAFMVSAGSSLEKLVQAYIAQGGNPMAISLWLQPDNMQFPSEGDPGDSEDDDPNARITSEGFEDVPWPWPYGGVVSEESTTSYGVGGQYKGGISMLRRDLTRMAGRYLEEGDAGAKIAIKMDHARRWVAQEIGELRHLEYRIIKLMDLREQLMHERDTLIAQAIGGSVPDYPSLNDPERFATELHLTRIVSQMDQTFYVTDENGEPDFTILNLGTRPDGTQLGEATTTISGESAQVNPGGLARQPTLFPDPAGTDPYTGSGTA